MKKAAFSICVICAVMIQPASSYARRNFTYVNGEKVEYLVDESSSTFFVSMDEKIERVVYGRDVAPDADVLYPSFADAAGHATYRVLPSFEQIGSLGKATDDRVYATIEIAIEGDKIDLLTGLAQELDGGGLAFICTALILSGSPDSCPAKARDAAIREADNFIKRDPYNSRPIGFYTWNDGLKNIFTRDRWLQKKFDTRIGGEFAVAKGISEAVKKNPRLKKIYGEIINVYSMMTNPSTNFSSALDPITKDKPFAFFPPSRSRETDLVNKYVAKGNVAAGRTMDLLIDAVRKGDVSLRPSARFEGSGFYDYQQFALEPFLLPEKMPEGKKLSFNGTYRKRLENAFRSAVTQARETHVKQLERPGEVGAEAPEPLEIELFIAPRLEVEPMPTYYKRMASAYLYLIKALDVPLLNSKALHLIDEPDGKPKDLTREDYHLSQLNKPPIPLQGRLRDMNSLFIQFSARSSLDIGMADGGEGQNRAEDFLSGWKGWPEMRRDIRAIVPIGPVDAKDPSKGVNYWAVIGIQPMDIEVRYEKKPVVKVLRKNVKAKIEYGRAFYTILVPVFVEAIIPGASPPTREEFRKVCDRYKTRDAILAALRKGNFQ